VGLLLRGDGSNGKRLTEPEQDCNATMPKRNKLPLAITAWYANEHRIFEMCEPGSLSALPTFPGARNAVLGRLALDLLRIARAPSLERLLLEHKVKTGMQFTFEYRFNSAGLAGLSTDGPPRDATLTASLNEFGDSRQVVIKFNSAGILTTSGRPSVFVFAYIRDITPDAIIASPFVIGDLMTAPGSFGSIRWRDDCKVCPESIGIFSKVDFARRLPKDALEQVKAFPEERFKQLVCSEVGIPIPKDWGGETCDISTPNLKVGGQRTDASWLLKGPAKFRPLTPRDCGKNGDQIPRLFDNPSGLFILQHCHKVEPSVTKMMYAFIREPSRIGARFCIIDGYDTWRIFKHFGVIR